MTQQLVTSWRIPISPSLDFFHRLSPKGLKKKHILIYWENHLSRIHGKIIQYCSLWKNRWAPLVYTCSDSYHGPIIRLLNRGNHLWITQSVGDIWFHHPNLNGTSCRITATARRDLLLLPSEAQKIPTEKGPKSLEPYRPIASGSGWGREKSHGHCMLLL